MPPKKAAKHAPKKAAKHAPKKAAKHAAKAASAHDNALRDSLRAYEHLGRVQVLASLLARDAAETVKRLGTFARAALELNEARDSAELLRAAEHFCFGALSAAEDRDDSVSRPLKERIEGEYNALRERGDMQAEDIAHGLEAVYAEMAALSSRAVQTGRYRAALEMARGAEALTHVEGDFQALGGGTVPARAIRSRSRAHRE